MDGNVLSSVSIDATSMETALDYARRGFNPTPLVPGSKATRLPDWNNTTIAEADVPTVFRADDGIGLVLGESSGGLVVVDVDSPEAVALADRFLPDTGMVDGRPGKPASHRFYRCNPLPAYASFKSAAMGGKAIVELLGKGRQVVVPPTTIEGNRRAWVSGGDPLQIDPDALTRRVVLLAVACELAAVWPTSGGRHDAALPAAGGLLRAGVDDSDVEAILGAVWPSAEDGEVARIVADTAEKLGQEGVPVAGWPKLAELTGNKSAIDRIRHWLGADEGDERPSVCVTQGNLDRMSNRAWQALASANEERPVLFRRSNKPVRVERIDGGDTVIIRDLDRDRLRHHAAGAIRWYQMKEGRPNPVKPPVEVIADMLAHPDIPLPVLERVVTVPVFAPDGTLQTAAGYHPAARVYHEPPADLTIPHIPSHPSNAEVEGARALLLDDLLADFPFADDAGKAHALALALLPLVRDLIDGPTPMHLFEAAKAGTGKGLLVRVLTMLTTGTGAAETPLSNREEELQKKLLAVLLEGRPFVLFDNVNERIDSASLAAALTSTVYTDRVLGISGTAHLPVRCGWIATGNNVDMTTEVARRTIRTRLVAEEEYPHLRKDFKYPSLVRHVAQHRGRYLGALLTLAQAWIAAGQPQGRATLGSFESWAAVMGGILDVAGVPGFLSNAAEFYAASDNEGTAWRAFVEAWWERFGPERVTGKDLVALAAEAGFPFNATTTDKQAIELGKLLGKQIDGVYAGFAIRKRPAPRGSRSAYGLEARNGQEWTPPAPAVESGVLTLNGRADPSILLQGTGRVEG